MESHRVLGVDIGQFMGLPYCGGCTEMLLLDLDITVPGQATPKSTTNVVQGYKVLRRCPAISCSSIVSEDLTGRNIPGVKSV